MADDALDSDLDGEITLANEKALTWYDVSAIGTGEMLFTGGWAYIMFVGSLYGIKWTLIGFCCGALFINAAWWLYREMITAVPEPGSLQSFAREAGLFSLGSAYFVAYAPTYACFMWIELLVAKGLLHLMFPSVAEWIWPFVIILPVFALNLMGHQITGKVQAVLVTITLVGDICLGIAIWWLIADRHVWEANWESPTPISWLTIFSVTGLWLAAMAGILEVQQVLVDEWTDFKMSRDVGLLSAAYQLWARQLPLALGLFATFPLAILATMPVPTVQAVQEKLGHGPLFYLALVSMLVATYTTLSVYFMAEGKVLALYSQQGALPRVVGKYSSRSVPWVALVILLVMALLGGFLSGYDFLINTLASWSATLYLVVAVIFIGMRRRKDLDRPLVARFGMPIAIAMVIGASMIAVSAVVNNWRAAATWAVFISFFILYDWLIVPRTERGRFYRAQVLRRRTSAARL